ncbi:hypothetical protein MBLNU230_g8216t1 [Neophaeotheca triangularis]
MGNDGGSIPTRRELVKEAARAPTQQQLKANLTEKTNYNWKHDPVSKQPLAEPIVSDARGRLYNKATVLEFVVEGKWAEELGAVGGGEVGGMGDVVEVVFARGDGDGTAWRCPVSAERLGAEGVKAVYVVPCGHAFAASVLKEVETDGRCLVCEGRFAANDVVNILPVAEADVARLEVRVKRLRELGLRHSLKKEKGKKETKEKKKRKGEENGVGEEKRRKAGDQDAGINSEATAKLTAKVVAEQELAKKRKVQQSDNVASLFSKPQDPTKSGKNTDFMTRGFTVPADAKR